MGNAQEKPVQGEKGIVDSGIPVYHSGGVHNGKLQMSQWNLCCENLAV